MFSVDQRTRLPIDQESHTVLGEVNGACVANCTGLTASVLIGHVFSVRCEYLQ